MFGNVDELKFCFVFFFIFGISLLIPLIIILTLNKDGVKIELCFHIDI